MVQVSKCLVHSSGALLLDPADMLLWDENLEPMHLAGQSSRASMRLQAGPPSMPTAASQQKAPGHQPDGIAMWEPGSETADPAMQQDPALDMPASDWDAGGLGGDDDDDCGGAGDMDHYDPDGDAAMDASMPVEQLHEAAGESFLLHPMEATADPPFLPLVSRGLSACHQFQQARRGTKQWYKCTCHVVAKT